MKKFVAIFKKVGGWEILRQYARAHVLLFALVQTALNGFSKKSLEILRLSVNNRILRKLRKKSKCLIRDFKANRQPQPQKSSKTVWEPI